MRGQQVEHVQACHRFRCGCRCAFDGTKQVTVMGQLEGKYSEVGIQLGGMANPLGFGWLLLSFPVGCSRIIMRS